MNLKKRNSSSLVTTRVRPYIHSYFDTQLVNKYRTPFTEVDVPLLANLLRKLLSNELVMYPLDIL